MTGLKITPKIRTKFYVTSNKAIKYLRKDPFFQELNSIEGFGTNPYKPEGIIPFAETIVENLLKPVEKLLNKFYNKKPSL